MAMRNGTAASAIIPGRPRLGFVFTGLGAQWYAMGRELVQTSPVFSEAVSRAGAMLRGYGASWLFEDELFRDEATTCVSNVELAEPMSVAVQLCLVDLLHSMDIVPSAVTSHSNGEIAAAYAVGALSFEAALTVVYHRGRLCHKHYDTTMASSGMLAVAMDPHELQAKYLRNLDPALVVLGCVNSPRSGTLSGDLAAPDDVACQLDKNGIFSRRVNVPVAYHSPRYIDPLTVEYTQALEHVSAIRLGHDDCDKDDHLKKGVCGLLTGTVSFTSPVTGDFITRPDAFTPEHWARGITRPNFFMRAFENMCFESLESDSSNSKMIPSTNVDMVIEIGPHSALSGPIRQILRARNATHRIKYVSCLIQGVDAAETMRKVVGELVASGYPVSQEALSLECEIPHCQHNMPPGSPCCKLTWEPVLVPTSLEKSLRIHLDDDQIEYETKLQRVSYHLIHDAVAELKLHHEDFSGSSSSSISAWSQDHELLIDWMKLVVRTCNNNTWTKTSKIKKQILADEVYASDSAGQMTVQVGRNLARIVRGEVSPLELMCQGNLLSRYLEQLPRLKNRTYKHLGIVVELLAVKKHSIAVLEIGAGAGAGKAGGGAIAATKVVLDAFEARGGHRPRKYVFTHSSSDFLGDARRDLAQFYPDYIDKIEFKVFDIDSDQFEPSGTYDLIVASYMPLLASRLSQHITNVRRLLRPGGKLVVVAPIRDHASLDTQLLFETLLPGCYSRVSQGRNLYQEDPRTHSRRRARDTWDVVLQAEGFSGVELDVADCEEAAWQSTHLILTTAVASSCSARRFPFPSAISVAVSSEALADSLSPPSWLLKLAESIRAGMGTFPKIQNPETVDGPDHLGDNRVFVLTPEATEELIADKEPGLPCMGRLLKLLLPSSRGVLWISRHGVMSASSSYRHAAVAGRGPNPPNCRAQAKEQELLRTLRRELGPEKRCVQLDFDPNGYHPSTPDDGNTIIGHIVHVMRENFDYNRRHDDCEWIYVAVGECLHVPRPVSAYQPGRSLAPRTTVTTKKESQVLTESTLVVEAIVTKLAEMLNLPPAGIDPRLSPARDYGVDSLAAIELHEWLASHVGVRLSVLDILQVASLTELGSQVAARIQETPAVADTTSDNFVPNRRPYWLAKL